MSVKFVLGTAEFSCPQCILGGLDASENERFENLLQKAEQLGFGLLDVCLGYSHVLGRIGRSRHRQFDVIARIPQGIEVEDLEPSLTEALVKTGKNTLYGAVFQSQDEILAHDFDQRLQVIQQLRQDGVVGKIGVVVHDINAIFPLLNQIPFQFIQVPVNTLDRRAAKAINKLKQSRPDMEIQANTVFLRGALLSNPTALPPHLTVLQNEVDWFLTYCEELQINPGVAALRTVLELPVDALIIDAADQYELSNAYNWFIQAQALDFTVPERPFHKQFDPRSW